MRDIADYEVKYKVEPCEQYQVKYRREKVISILKDYKHEVILEVGCGLEPLFLYFQDYKKMIVVEPAKSFITEAKKKSGGGKNNNILFINGMLEEAAGRIKEIGDGLDYIIIGSLLHEVEKPEKLLRSIYEICSDNTVVHINVPNANSIHRLLAKEMGIIKDVHELSELQIEMQRHNVFDLTQLCELVELWGFQVIDKGAYFPKLFSARQMKKILDAGIVDETIFDGLNKMIRYLPEFGSEIYVQVKKKV